MESKSNELILGLFYKTPQEWRVDVSSSRDASERKLGIVSPRNNKYGGRLAKLSGAPFNMVFVS